MTEIDPKKQVGGVEPHLTSDPIVVLLYMLMRDHLSAGIFEKFFEEMATVERDREIALTNPFLAGYAENIAMRLKIEAGAADEDRLRGVLERLEEEAFAMSEAAHHSSMAHDGETQILEERRKAFEKSAGFVREALGEPAERRRDGESTDTHHAPS